MNQPDESGTPGSESFEERLSSLFEELDLAVRWNRPSILVAVYESEQVRRKAQAALTDRLAGIGQAAAEFRISETNYDVPLILAQRPEREGTVFFVSGLKWGGSKGGQEAFRALNLHREYFVDFQVRAVFWLTQAEAAELPQRSPDFWAFRHRVIEFLDAPDREDGARSAPDLAWGMGRADELREDLDGKIALRRQLLDQLPDGDESLIARLDLFYDLACLLWAGGDLRQSGDLLKKGLELAGRVRDAGLQSRFWTGLGILRHSRQQFSEALTAYQNAIQLDAGAAVPRLDLAILLRDLGRYDDAIQACEEAAGLSPAEAAPQVVLGGFYRDLGRLEEARETYRLAARLDPRDPRPWLGLGRVFRELDRPREALRALRKAVRLAPRAAPGWQALGRTYTDLGRSKEAVEAYRTAVDLDPDDDESKAALEAAGKAAPSARR